jgi:glycosyltransferase involved in cell wall biosynthesis
MPELRRAAFIRTADWPPANESTYRALAAEMPDTTIDLIETKRLLRGKRGLLVRNSLETVRLYGLKIAQRKRSFKDAFFRTPYLFHALKRLINERLAQQRYDFSFQMQSIFDASRDGLPHFVYTDHTHLANLYYSDFDHRRLYAQSWIKLERAIYQRAALNFTRSTNISHSLVEQYGCDKDRVACVYAGSNARSTRTSLNEQKYASKRILFVGIDWERKGGPELVAAFRQVLDAIPEAQLTIVGCTPTIDLPNCQVVGRVPLDQVDAFYEQAALFCLPTKIEPFGIVFVEAMSHSLPLVAMHTGAVPDFVESGVNGALLKLGDVDGLARALIALLGDPERCRAAGAASYRLTEQRYSWPHVARAMHQHIRASVEAHAARAG